MIHWNELKNVQMETGFDRIYFTVRGKNFCLQSTHRGGFALYSCSKAVSINEPGEPVAELPLEDFKPYLRLIIEALQNKTHQLAQRFRTWSCYVTEQEEVI